jgi:outer membrane protein assembly factor BamB
MQGHLMKKQWLPRLILSTVILCVNTVFAADWPQWRGPNRDGVWSETQVVSTFTSPQLPIRWRAPIANGYSGPTIANGLVYVTDRLTEPNELERVLCFNAATGKAVWSFQYPCKYQKISYPDGPRTSVTINDGRAYSLGTTGLLYCFDAAKGTVLWSRDLNKEYKIKMPMWGISASPLVEGNSLILQIGGDKAGVVALDKTSGKEIWKALDDPLCYSSPIMIQQTGKRVLVCMTAARVVGLDPLTGKLDWEIPFPSPRGAISVATPVFKDNFLFVTSFFDGSLMIKVAPDQLTAKEVWRRKGADEQHTDALHSMITTPIMLGDCIYGIDSYGELRCLKRDTGDRVWVSQAVMPNARWATAHLVQNGAHTWMFNERGELIISTLSPDGYKEISRTKLIEPTTGQLESRGGVCWTHPAFADKCIFIRNDKELICADLSQK